MCIDCAKYIAGGGALSLGYLHAYSTTHGIIPNTVNNTYNIWSPLGFGCGFNSSAHRLCYDVARGYLPEDISLSNFTRAVSNDKHMFSPTLLGEYYAKNNIEVGTQIKKVFAAKQVLDAGFGGISDAYSSSFDSVAEAAKNSKKDN